MWTKEQIVSMLETNDKAVTRAVVAIYNRQTVSEQAAQQTKVTNNVGFNHSDAPYLSYCAKYAIDKRVHLSGKHLEKARVRVRKYWKQLLDIANSNNQIEV